MSYLDNCTKISIETATTPSDEALVKMNRWWVVTPDSEILFYKGCSAQCNTDRSIAESIAGDKGLDVVYLACVYIPSEIWYKWY